MFPVGYIQLRFSAQMHEYAKNLSSSLNAHEYTIIDIEDHRTFHTLHGVAYNVISNINDPSISNISVCYYFLNPSQRQAYISQNLNGYTFRPRPNPAVTVNALGKIIPQS